MEATTHRSSYPRFPGLSLHGQPALGSVLGELFYGWSGNGNLRINVAPVALTGFADPPYCAEASITNFPVNAGDYVTVSITYSGTSFGIIHFYNQASGQSFKLTLPKPPGVQMPGGTAEWIMEAINGGYPGTHLPQFSNVVFSSAYACSQGDTTTGNPQNADTDASKSDAHRAEILPRRCR